MLQKGEEHHVPVSNALLVEVPNREEKRDHNFCADPPLFHEASLAEELLEQVAPAAPVLDYVYVVAIFERPQVVHNTREPTVRQRNEACE